MIYLLRYTIANSPHPFYVEVDSEDALAEAVDKIKKKGYDATIHIFKTTQLSYNLTYIEEEEIITKQIPNIEILQEARNEYITKETDL